MSSRISEDLNKATDGGKSCFNCLFFKIKPFKFNKLDNSITIDFKLVETVGRCSKEAFNTNISRIRKSANSKNKFIILRDALKSIIRYRTMAENCAEYDGENVSITKKKCIKNNKKVKYKLVKYLF